MADDASATGNQLVAFYQVQPSTRRNSNELGVELLPISRANGFVLPGPAVAGIVYVRHPSDHGELIAFADYDERLAQDRYDEVLRVFTKLGAARIVATSHRQISKQRRGGLRFRQSGLTVDVHNDSAWSLSADMEGAGGAPVDPRPLRFRDIPGLDTVCEGVLKLGWKKGKIQITRSSNYGVDSELGFGLRKSGFRLGVSGSKAMVTEILVEAAFAKEASRDLDKLVAKTEAADLSAARRPLLRRRVG